MTFAHPLAIVLTLAGCVLAYALARRALQGRSRDALAYSNLAFLEAAAVPRFPWVRAFAVVWLGALACIGLAFAGPRIVAPVSVRDGAVALCIDTSGSMRAGDVTPTRAAAAERAAKAFVDGVPEGTRVAVIAFASSAGVVAPATDDKDAVRSALDQLPTPNGGTAIGDALALAARSLPAVHRRAIVLVTDGVNNAGADPLQVAAAIGQSGISIYTVGIGTNGSGQLIPGTDQEANLDEDALRSIARSGHGDYARAVDAASLEKRLAGLAAASTRESRRVDLSLPLAIVGGFVLAGASLGALTLGRLG